MTAGAGSVGVATAVSGPVVLITGAAGGIGSALARRWARDGARLVLLDVDEKGLERLAGEHVLALPCDVTEEAACRRAVEAAVDRFGGIDILVANAGRTHLSFVADTDVAVLRRIMDVNFFGAVHVTRAALPWLAARRGRIAVLSSVAGFAPLAGRSGYAASKHALHGFFGSLRGEVAAEGVSVTLACPAFVRTSIGASALGGDGGPAVEPRTEVGRPMEPDRVADIIVRAVARRRRLVLVGGVGKAAWWAWRLWPRLYEGVMMRRLARAQAEGREGP